MTKKMHQRLCLSYNSILQKVVKLDYFKAVKTVKRFLASNILVKG